MTKTEGAIKSLLHRALVSLRRSLVGGQHEAAIFGHVRSSTGAGYAAAANAEPQAIQQIAPPEW